MQKKKTRNQPNPFVKVLGNATYAALIIFSVAAGSIGGWLNTSKAVQHVGLYRFLHPKQPTELFGKDSETILVLGCDEDRTVGGAKISQNRARSDMMLLARLDFKNKLVGGVSIPRDIYLKMPGRHSSKMNAFHVYGGNDLSKQAVERLLPGVQIDKVVTLDFDGFQQMVDAVGGVSVSVEKKMDYDDNAGHLHIHLRPGQQMLNGQTALAYVRFRHSDSDLIREDRQHNFMLAFKGAVASNPSSLPKVLDETTKMLSDGLNDEEVITLGTFVNSIPKENIKFGRLPVLDAPHGGLSLITSRVPALLTDLHLINPGVRSVAIR